MQQKLGNFNEPKPLVLDWIQKQNWADVFAFIKELADQKRIGTPPGIQSLFPSAIKNLIDNLWYKLVEISKVTWDDNIKHVSQGLWNEEVAKEFVETLYQQILVSTNKDVPGERNGLFKDTLMQLYTRWYIITNQIKPIEKRYSVALTAEELLALLGNDPSNNILRDSNNLQLFVDISAWRESAEELDAASKQLYQLSVAAAMESAPYLTKEIKLFGALDQQTRERIWDHIAAYDTKSLTQYQPTLQDLAYISGKERYLDFLHIIKGTRREQHLTPVFKYDSIEGIYDDPITAEKIWEQVRVAKSKKARELGMTGYSWDGDPARDYSVFNVPNIETVDLNTRDSDVLDHIEVCESHTFKNSRQHFKEFVESYCKGNNLSYNMENDKIQLRKQDTDSLVQSYMTQLNESIITMLPEWYELDSIELKDNMNVCVSIKIWWSETETETKQFHVPISRIHSYMMSSIKDEQSLRTRIIKE